jgi:hypothetical protein
MDAKLATTEGRCITVDFDPYEHFREAVHWIPTTDADFEADGSLSEHALHRITNLAVDIVCTAEYRLGTFPTADMQLNARGNNLYGIATQEVMTGPAVELRDDTLTATQKAVIAAAFTLAANQRRIIRTMARRHSSHCCCADFASDLPF